MDVPSRSQFQSMVSVSYAKKFLANLISATLPFWAGMAVAQAETPKDYTAPPKSTEVTAPGPGTATMAGESAPTTPSQPTRTLFIQEYRVLGSKILSPQEIGDTVYPFLGPGRTLD